MQSATTRAWAPGGPKLKSGPPSVRTHRRGYGHRTLRDAQSAKRALPALYARCLKQCANSTCTQFRLRVSSPGRKLIIKQWRRPRWPRRVSLPYTSLNTLCEEACSAALPQHFRFFTQLLTHLSCAAYGLSTSQQEPPPTFEVDWHVTGFVVAGLAEGNLDSDAIRKAFVTTSPEPR